MATLVAETNHSRDLSEKRLKEANDVKSKYDKSCEEIEMLQTEVKRLTTQLNNNVRPVTNEESSRNPELIGLRDEVWELQLTNEDLRSTNENYQKQIENANFDSYWRTKYDELWDSQGDYETGFRDGSKNSVSYLNSPQHIHQKTIIDMKKVWDQVRRRFYSELTTKALNLGSIRIPRKPILNRLKHSGRKSKTFKKRLII